MWVFKLSFEFKEINKAQHLQNKLFKTGVIFSTCPVNRGARNELTKWSFNKLEKHTLKLSKIISRNSILWNWFNLRRHKKSSRHKAENLIINIKLSVHWTDPTILFNQEIEFATHSGPPQSIIIKSVQRLNEIYNQNIGVISFS